MIVVVDPGVAIKWFVEGPLRPQARSLLANRHEMIAPDILIAGVAELAWRKASCGEITVEQAEPIVRNIALPSFISAFVESPQLRTRALAMCRPKHLFCAESFFGGVLLRIDCLMLVERIIISRSALPAFVPCSHAAFAPIGPKLARLRHFSKSSRPSQSSATGSRRS